MKFMSEQTRTKLLGDFGEYVVAWYLRSRYGVDAHIVKSEGIDILATGNAKPFFDNRAIVAISVKTRQRSSKGFKESVNADWNKIRKKARKWNAVPFIAYLRIAPDKGKITCYLTPVEKAITYSKGDVFNVNRAEKDRGNILFEMNFVPYRKIS